jgi:tryptophanase
MESLIQLLARGTLPAPSYGRIRYCDHHTGADDYRIEYVIELILEVWKRREGIGGLKLACEAPFLRHFTAEREAVKGPLVRGV